MRLFIKKFVGRYADEWIIIQEHGGVYRFCQCFPSYQEAKVVFQQLIRDFIAWGRLRGSYDHTQIAQDLGYNSIGEKANAFWTRFPNGVK